MKRSTVPSSSPPIPAARASSQRRRVLIVDDNTELVDTLRAVIASGIQGIAIDTAESGGPSEPPFSDEDPNRASIRIDLSGIGSHNNENKSGQ